MARLTPARALAALERDDKWYLGAGGPLLWAPPFPRFLDRPGFQDEAHYFGHPLPMPFALALLDRRGRALPLRLERRSWLPWRLRQTFASPTGARMVEERSVAPFGALISQLTLATLLGGDELRALVVWTAQPASALAEDGVWLYQRRLERPGVPPLDVWVALGTEPKPEALAAAPWVDGEPPTEWGQTPLAEAPWSAGEARGGSAGRAVLALRLALAGQRERFLIRARIACAVGPSPETALERLDRALGPRRSRHGSTTAKAAWTRFASRVPRFSCSDPYLERAYWYRWYMLFLNTVEQPEAGYRHPFVCEGIGYFRAPISYSAPAMLRDLRWLQSPRLAQGLVRTFLDLQRPDGSFPGHVFASGTRAESFYHADWGQGLRALFAVHPDPRFVREVFGAFERYAEHLSRERDPDGSGLVEVWNQFETGQEYSPRYAFAQPDVDEALWGQQFRLKGVDASVYAYQLYRWLAENAALAGRPERAEHWEARARQTAKALQRHCWDEQRGFFVDVLPGSFARSPVRAATGLYPFATDLVDETHLRALREHLLDPAAFWTPYPVPTVSVDDPLFSPDGIWRGARRTCPWNGRVWPMVNSHIVDALACAAGRLDPALAPWAAELLRRFARMLFWNGDPRRPNCFEHYHPFDGSPSAYRGIDDYVHSWLVDLIIRYVCGLRPEVPDQIVARPLSFDLERFELEGARVRGQRVDLTWERARGLRLYLEGKLAAHCDELGEARASAGAR